MEQTKPLDETDRLEVEPPAYPPMRSPSVSPISLENLERYRASLGAQQVGPVNLSNCVMFSNAISVMVITVLLSQDENDCETPIRLWLTVYALTCGIGVALQFSGELTKLINSQRLKQFVVRLVYAAFAFFSLFNIVWFILGNLWLYGDDECEDSFQAGYITALVILVCHYVIYGGLCCLISCVFCCACMAGVATAAAQG